MIGSTAIEAWLAFQFNLPSVERQPHIELAPPGRIAALRYQGLLSGSGRENASNGASDLSSERDIVAVYSDEAQTIFLPEGWTGTTPAELSILVHELVHHVQNAAGLKYACPQEREKVDDLGRHRQIVQYRRRCHLLGLRLVQKRQRPLARLTARSDRHWF